MNTGYEVGQKVWDKFLNREDEIVGISIMILKTGKSINYKLMNHTSWVSADGISREEGCSCPPKYNDGRSFDGVSYHCPKHGR